MSQFSMEDLKKRIQEQTVISMGMMMPEEHLKQLVDEAVTSFFDTTHQFAIVTENSNYYSSQRASQTRMTASPFTLMVWERVSKIAAKAIDEYFTQESTGVTEAIKSEVISDEFKHKAGQALAILAPSMARIESLQHLQVAIDLTKDKIVRSLHHAGIMVFPD